MRGTVFLNGLAPDGGAVVQLSARARVIEFFYGPVEELDQPMHPHLLEAPELWEPHLPKLTELRASRLGLPGLGLRPMIDLDPELVDPRPPRDGEEDGPGPVPGPFPPFPRPREVPVAEVAEVPATVTVPAGQQRGDFTVRTKRVPDETILEVTASYEGQARGGQVFVLPAERPVAVAGLRVEPPTITVRDVARGTVSLTRPAPSHGATVELSNSEPAAVRLEPAPLLVPPGQAVASFTIRPAVADRDVSVTITAALGGESRSAPLSIERRVDLPIPVLTSLELLPPDLVGGLPLVARLVLSVPAPPQGATVVELSSSDPEVAPVPERVTVPAGRQELMAEVRTLPIEEDTEVEIRATLGPTLTRTLHVRRGDGDSRECEQLRPRLPVLERRRADLERRLEELTATTAGRIRALEGGIAARRQELEHGRVRVNGEVQSLQAEIARLQQAFEQRRGQANAEIARLRQEIARLRPEFDRRREQVNRDIADLQAQLAGVQQGIAQRRQEVNGQIANLQAEISRLQRDRDSRRTVRGTEITRLEGEIASLRQALEQRSAGPSREINSLLLDIDRLNKLDETSLNEEIKRNEEELRGIPRGDYPSEEEWLEATAPFRAAIDSAKRGLAEIRTRSETIARHEGRIRSLGAQINQDEASTQAQINERQGTIDTRRREDNDDEANTQGQVNERNGRIQALGRQLQQEDERTTAQISDLNTRIEVLRGQLQQEEERLRRQTEEMNGRITALEREIQQDQVTMQGQVNDVQGRIDGIQREWQQEEARVTAQIRRDEEELGRLQGDLREQTASLTGELQQVATEIEQIGARMRQLKCPPIPTLIDVPRVITAGVPVTGSVEISVPAPPDGFAVDLAVDDADLVVLPERPVRIPPRELGAEFPIRAADEVAARTAVELSVPDVEAVALQFDVVPEGEVKAAEVELDRSALTPGTTATGIVKLNAPAGRDGADVRLESSVADVVRVPSTVTVAPGETSASFALTAAEDVTEATPVVIRGFFKDHVEAEVRVQPV